MSMGSNPPLSAELPDNSDSTVSLQIISLQAIFLVAYFNFDTGKGRSVFMKGN